jgi:hypothetical protein
MPREKRSTRLAKHKTTDCFYSLKKVGIPVQTWGKIENLKYAVCFEAFGGCFNPDFLPAEVAVDVRREARCYSSLCTLLLQRCR